MTDHPKAGDVPLFIGSHGDDWCCRPAELGPPDRVNKMGSSWLLIPGPPLSCYLVSFAPLEDSSRLSYYHSHPTTWSLHIVLSGEGEYTADGITHQIGPGTVMYHGPNVPHCGPWPNVGTSMQILVVQHPSAGHRTKEWVVRPDFGTREAFRDIAAFTKTYGVIEGDDLFKYIDHAPNKAIVVQPDSARWRHYMTADAKKPL